MTERTPGPQAARGVPPGSPPAGPAAHAHPHEHGDDTEPHADNDCAMTAGPHVTDATGVTTRGDAAVPAEARAGYDVDAGIAARRGRSCAVRHVRARRREREVRPRARPALRDVRDAAHPWRDPRRPPYAGLG